MLQDPAAKVAATHALALIGYDGALDPLIALLKDDNSAVHWLAVEGLGELKDPRAVPALIAALGQEDPYMDETIADALRAIGEPAVGPLLTALKDPDAKKRSGAATALGHMEDGKNDEGARISQALIASLNDTELGVRGTAEWALVNNRRQLHSVESLIAVLKDDPDENLRRYAAQILGETQNQRALQPLTDALNDKNSFVQAYAAEALKAVNLAGAAGPPPTSDVAYKVISTFDLTGPFHTKTKWRFTVFQMPDTCDPGTSDGCNGAYEFCLIHLDRSKCDEAPGVVFDDASIVVPDHGPPLLVTTTRPDVATSGGSVESIDFWAYLSKSDTFASVFSNQSSSNNNEETRIMKRGPLAGMIIVASQGARAPYGYGITAYRLSKTLKYAQVLKYVGKTRYQDGDAMAVIDSEMPEIERRLGFWKPGDPLPVPERTRCTSYVLKHGIEWCP
jgi:HEAT repeat protein